jgi:hypothetical protein
MGAEIVLFYFLPAGVVLGTIGALWVGFRSSRTGWVRVTIIISTFILGLVLPTLCLVAFGTYLKLVQPQPKLTHLMSIPFHSQSRAMVRSNPVLVPTGRKHCASPTAELARGTTPR